MTYKRLAMELVERTAHKWIEKILKENGVEYEWIFHGDLNMENDPKLDTFLWEYTASIKFQNGERICVIAGGTADDLIGVSESVLWNVDKKILWMANKATREQLGITEFNLEGEGK